MLLVLQDSAVTVDLEQIGLSGWEGASSETKRCVYLEMEITVEPLLSKPSWGSNNNIG